MTDKRSWGSTVLGWFVVREGEAAPGEGSLGEGEERSPGEAAASPGAACGATVPGTSLFEGDAPPAPGGNVDFEGVFEAGGIATSERDLFAKAAGLLSNLPQGTDPATRKTIVEASLKAFGIPIDQIIETGALSIQTLEAYLQQQADKTKSVAEESQQLIADYEAKIRDVKALLDRRIAEQGAVQASCNGKVRL